VQITQPNGNILNTETGVATLPTGVHVHVAISVSEKVNAIQNLTDDQRARVLEIAVAAASKHLGVEPNYEGIANLVRSQAARRTPNTLEANKGKL
jgi:hypothetical protein